MRAGSKHGAGATRRLPRGTYVAGCLESALTGSGDVGAGLRARQFGGYAGGHRQSVEIRHLYR